MKRVISPIINHLFTPLPSFTHHIKSILVCCRFSAYSPKAARRLEEDSRNVAVSVWWDFANCNLPAGTNVFKVTTHITAAIRTNGIKGPIQITAFGDVLQLTRSNQEALSSTGITLTHIPQGGRNSSDRSLLVDLMYWVSQNPPPSHILLISSDKDFASVLHRLRMNNYNVLLASLEPVPSVLCSAASIMWHWHALLRGENITGMHFNQPPDGPHFSWYGQFRVPLEDPFSSSQHPSSSPSPRVKVLPHQPGTDSKLCTVPTESSDAVTPPVSHDPVQTISEIPTNIGVPDLNLPSKPIIESDFGSFEPGSQSHEPSLAVPIPPGFKKPTPDKEVATGVTTAAQLAPSVVEGAADVTTVQPTPSVVGEQDSCSEVDFIGKFWANWIVGSKVNGSVKAFNTSDKPPLPDKKVADEINTPSKPIKEQDSNKLSSPDKMFADVRNAPLTPVMEKEFVSKVVLSPKLWMNSTLSKDKFSLKKSFNSSVKSPTLDHEAVDVISAPVVVKQDYGSKVGFFHKFWTNWSVSKESDSSEKGLNSSVKSPSPDKEIADVISASSTPPVKRYDSDSKVSFSQNSSTNIPKDNGSPEKPFNISVKSSSLDKSLSIDKEMADVTNAAQPTPSVEVKQEDPALKVVFFQNIWTNLTVPKEISSSENGSNNPVICPSPDKRHDSDPEVILSPKSWTNAPKDSSFPEKSFSIEAKSPSLDMVFADVTSFLTNFWTKWIVPKDNDSPEKAEKPFNIQVESPSTVHTSKSGENWEEPIGPSTNPAQSASCTSAPDDNTFSSSKEVDDKNAVLLKLIMNWQEFWRGEAASEIASGHLNKHSRYRNMYRMKKNEVLFCKDYFWNELEAFLETPKAAGIISESKNRDEVAQALRNEGPRVLRSLEGKNLQRLVELLISEKKWLEECSSGPSNFKLKLASLHKQKVSSLGLQPSNALRPKPPAESESWNDDLSYPPKTSDDSHGSINKSRDAMLSDCEKLVADLMKEMSGGFNVCVFRNVFRHRYGYLLRYQKLGYPSLSSLLRAIPGVRIRHNKIIPDINFRKEDAKGDHVWDELGQVVLSPKAKEEEKEESDYDYSLRENELSDEEGSYLDKSGRLGKVTLKEESSLVEILDSWVKKDDSSKSSPQNGSPPKKVWKNKPYRSKKHSKSIRFVDNKDDDW